MENIEFLAAAYAVFWGFTFVYVFSIARRQKNLERELQVLESLVADEQNELERPSSV
jgi:CcmD family protein